MFRLTQNPPYSKTAVLKNRRSKKSPYSKSLYFKTALYKDRFAQKTQFSKTVLFKTVLPKKPYYSVKNYTLRNHRTKNPTLGNRSTKKTQYSKSARTRNFDFWKKFISVRIFEPHKPQNMLDVKIIFMYKVLSITLIKSLQDPPEKNLYLKSPDNSF